MNIRIIAATNRNLINEVTKGNFREDLFYRIAVAVLRLPPLRERAGDLSILTDYLLKTINTESSSEPNWNHKEISSAARNLILQHYWPGNIRELANTLMRASIWSNSKIIEAEDIKEAILETPTYQKKDGTILHKDLSNGIDLQGILSEVAHHYLHKALDKTHGNKSQASELLGLGIYQTLSNWLKKYGIDE